MNTITVSFPPGSIDATASWEARYNPVSGKLEVKQDGAPTDFELRNVTIEVSDPSEKDAKCSSA